MARNEKPVEDWVWQTRDGRRIRLGDMGEAHLRNAIRMLDRLHAACDDSSLSALAYAAGAPDGAAFAAEREAYELQDKGYAAWAWGSLMRLELRRRGLEAPTDRSPLETLMVEEYEPSEDRMAEYRNG
jgi:hypothetical protein